jgi:hypothetical protein
MGPDPADQGRRAKIVLGSLQSALCDIGIAADCGKLLLLRLFERDLGGGDLAESRHDFLIITFHEWPRAFEQLLGALGGSEDQFEAIGDFLKTIFYGNSRHYPVIFRRNRSSVNAP